MLATYILGRKMLKCSKKESFFCLDLYSFYNINTTNIYCVPTMDKVLH